MAAVSEDPDGFNPYVVARSTAADLMDLLYPRLVRERWPAGDEPYEPWLARSWEFSADRLTLTFRLRDDARWSDGSPVTCADVAATLRAQTSEQLAWPGAFIKRQIREIACPDPHTAVFRFRRASTHQILDANDDQVIPARYLETPLGDWLATPWHERLVTCGPYRLERYVPDQEVVLARDPTFWGAPLPRIGRLVFRVHPDRDAAVRALLAGEVDLVDHVPPLAARTIAARDDLTLVDLPSFSYAFIAWNTLAPDAYLDDRRRRGCRGADPCGETRETIARLRARAPHPVLADARVRRALTLAIDRHELIEGVWHGYARPAASPIVSLLWAHDPSALLPYDPQAARRLLDEAGFVRVPGRPERRRGDVPLVLEVIVNADNRTRVTALERIAAQLATVGAVVRPVPLPRREFVDRARGKRFDGVLSGWRAGTRVEPQAILHGEAAVERGNNLGSWFTPESDALMDRAAAAPTRAQAAPLWRRWQRIFRDEQPYTMLWEQRTLIGLSGRVRDATPSPLNPYAGIERWALAGTGEGDSR
ncbi:MAG: hypothetical protein D6738_11840 [Acidobacteria bacterium]|nr:MAG: hypothetical protein D6738_11840 [Acidobacteriota bacterium]